MACKRFHTSNRASLILRRARWRWIRSLHPRAKNSTEIRRKGNGSLTKWLCRGHRVSRGNSWRMIWKTGWKRRIGNSWVGETCTSTETWKSGTHAMRKVRFHRRSRRSLMRLLTSWRSLSRSSSHRNKYWTSSNQLSDQKPAPITPKSPNSTMARKIPWQISIDYWCCRILTGWRKESSS